MQQKTSWNRINHAKCVDIGRCYLGVVNASNITVLEINHQGGFLGDFLALMNNTEYQHTRTIFALACHRALCHLFIGGFSDISSTESEIEYHLIRDADWSIQIFF